MKISLRLAPNVFFDSKKWGQFVGQFENAEVALARISVLPIVPGDGFHRSKDAGLPTERAARETIASLHFNSEWRWSANSRPI